MVKIDEINVALRKEWVKKCCDKWPKCDEFEDKSLLILKKRRKTLINSCGDDCDRTFKVIHLSPSRWACVSRWNVHMIRSTKLANKTKRKLRLIVTRAPESAKHFFFYFIFHCLCSFYAWHYVVFLCIFFRSFFAFILFFKSFVVWFVVLCYHYMIKYGFRTFEFIRRCNEIFFSSILLFSITRWPFENVPHANSTFVWLEANRFHFVYF